MPLYYPGDVVGPASATDNAVVRYDGATGKVVQNSLVTINDSGYMIVPVGDVDNNSIGFSGDAATGFFRRTAGWVQFMSQGNYCIGLGGGSYSFFQLANEFKFQRDAAYIMAINSQTNSPGFRLYNTTNGAPELSIAHTDYERIVIQCHAGAAYTIDSEAGGTGVARDIKFTGADVGIGIDPTAVLTLKAGTATAGTAPLKFTSGTVLTSVEAGAMEYFQNSLWFTNLAVRRTVVQGQNVITADQTIANTTTETTIFTQAHSANYLQIGKCEEIIIHGIVSSLSTGAPGTNALTVRVKYAGTTLGTFLIPKQVIALSSANMEIHVLITCRAIGNGTTTIQVHANAEVAGVTADPVFNGTSTGLNSTTAQATTVTVQWSDADAGNTTTIQQGYALSIDNNA